MFFGVRTTIEDLYKYNSAAQAKKQDKYNIMAPVLTWDVLMRRLCMYN